MKKVFNFFLSLILLSQISFAQEWTELLNQGKSFDEIKEYSQNRYFNPNGSTNPLWKQYSRWEYLHATRLMPDGSFPEPDHNLKEYRKYNQPNAQFRTSNWPTWSSDGPFVVGNFGSAGMGRLNFIEFHPSDSNIFYVGSPGGGVWKTLDEGATFNVLTDTLPSLGASDMAIDPTNPQILYLATGDRDGGDTRSMGILKSTNGGNSWDTTGLQYTVLQNKETGRIIINPENPNVLMTATGDGVYKTTDAGASWRRVQSSSVKDILYMPGDTNYVYAAGTSFFRSTDGGETWSQSVILGGVNRLEIAVTPANPAKVYAVGSNAANNGCRGVVVSSDSGASFVQVHGTSNPNLLGWASDGSDVGGQGWYDLAIAVSPTDENMIFVGGVNVWRTTDNGTTWTPSSNQSGQGSDFAHADCHELEFHPNGKLYACNDGGLFRSKDNGIDYVDLSNTLAITQSYKIGLSQHNQGDLLMGNQDNGTFRNLSGTYDLATFGDGFECIISPSDPLYMWSSSQFGTLYHSSDGGWNFGWSAAGITEQGAWSTPMVIDPWLDNLLYAGYDNIWKTTNRGASWSKANTSGFPGFGGKVNAMAVSQWWPDRVLAAKGNNLYLSQDGGSTWTRIRNSNSNSTSISYVAFDNKDLTGQTIWFTLSGYSSSSKAFKTTDLGSTWTNESAGLPNVPANCVEVDEGSTGPDVYIGTEIGVYVQNDSTGTFVPFSKGLPNVSVRELEIYEAGERLYAGTYGRGIWSVDLLSKGISGFGTYAKNGGLEILTYPNPASEFVKINVGGLQEDASIQISNVEGKEVYSSEGELSAFNVEVTIPLSSLDINPGIYFVTVKSGTSQVSKKILIQ